MIIGYCNHIFAHKVNDPNEVWMITNSKTNQMERIVLIKNLTEKEEIKIH